MEIYYLFFAGRHEMRFGMRHFFCIAIQLKYELNNSQFGYNVNVAWEYWLLWLSAFRDTPFQQIVLTQNNNFNQRKKLFEPFFEK